MLSVINTIPELYKTRMTGEIVVDSVVDVLRRTRAIFPEDVAVELNVDLKELGHAWHLLTNTKLRDAILEWRVCQARELIETKTAKAMAELAEKFRRLTDKELTEVAHQCGWRNLRVMDAAFCRKLGVSAKRIARAEN